MYIPRRTDNGYHAYSAKKATQRKVFKRFPHRPFKHQFYQSCYRWRNSDFIQKKIRQTKISNVFSKGPGVPHTKNEEQKAIPPEVKVVCPKVSPSGFCSEPDDRKRTEVCNRRESNGESNPDSETERIIPGQVKTLDFSGQKRRPKDGNDVNSIRSKSEYEQFPQDGREDHDVFQFNLEEYLAELNGWIRREKFQCKKLKRRNPSRNNYPTKQNVASVSHSDNTSRKRSSGSNFVEFGSSKQSSVSSVSSFEDTNRNRSSASSKNRNMSSAYSECSLSSALGFEYAGGKRSFDQCVDDTHRKGASAPRFLNTDRKRVFASGFFEVDRQRSSDWSFDNDNRKRKIPRNEDFREGRPQKRPRANY